MVNLAIDEKSVQVIQTTVEQNCNGRGSQEIRLRMDVDEREERCCR